MSARAALLNPRAVDVLLFVGVTVGVSAVVSANQGNTRPGSLLPYLWALGLGSLMLVRRTMPRVVLALTAVGFFTYYVLGFPAIGVAVPIAAALFSAAEAGHVPAAIATGAGVLLVSTGYRLLSGQDPAYVVGYELVSHAALVASVIALGYSVNARRALQRRTEQVVRLVSRQSAMDVATEAQQERIGLARELHDSIGHSLSVASLYTGVAKEATASPGGDPDEALRLVRGALTEAMSSLRSTVSLLRSPGHTAVPVPSLKDLPRLLDAPAAAGYQVALDVAELCAPALVESTVFRVVQESVTNTLRHSNGSRLSVRVATDGDGQVEVDVTDNGTTTRAPRFSPGHGLAGMRERVEALGGTLDVTPGPGGWRVHSRIPMGASS